MGRPGKKRLAVDISESMHYELKCMAHKSFMNISDYIKRAIVEKIAADHGEKEVIKFISEPKPTEKI